MPINPHSKPRALPKPKKVQKKRVALDHHGIIHSIAHVPSAPHSQAQLRKMAGNYKKFKAKGIDFHTLESAGWNAPMMITLGVPAHEIIIGRIAGKERGLVRLIHEVSNLSHSKDPAYRKLNFRTIVNHGVKIKTLLEHHVPYGLLIKEGFTDRELIAAGVPKEKIDNVRESHKKAPILFGLKPRPKQK